MTQTQPTVQRIATKALIVNDQGQMLILREAKTYQEGTNIGRYHLPGGRLEVGEAFQDGLRREVMEETGLQIEIGKPIYVGEWRPVIKGVSTQIVAIFFACQVLGGDVRLSEEHDDYQWISAGEVSSFDIMQPDDAVLAEYIAQAASSASAFE